MTEQFYPKGGIMKFGVGAWYPVNYNANTEYPVIIVGAGVGEIGDGGLAALKKLMNWWKLYTNVPPAVDKYGFIVVFVNTHNNYSGGEFPWVKDWVKANLPYKEGYIYAIGHSLGSYGLGNWGFTDAGFAKDVAAWVCSSSGGFNEGGSLYPNLVQNNIKVWGVTAINDTVVPASYVTRLAPKLKALDPNYPVVMTVFPATTWPDGKMAHNATIGKITTIIPPQVTWEKFNVTFPAPATALRMNLYEWLLSNPKGSVYQSPTKYYTGAVMLDQPPVETTTTSTTTSTTTQPPTTTTSTTTTTTTTKAPVKTVKRTGMTVSADGNIKNSLIIEIFWDQGATKDMYKGTVANRVVSIYHSTSLNFYTIQYANGNKVVVKATKEI